MKLSECTIGTLVIEKPLLPYYTTPRRIGHVVGLATDYNGQVMPVVQWAREFTLDAEKPRTSDVANLDRYTD